MPAPLTILFGHGRLGQLVHEAPLVPGERPRVGLDATHESVAVPVVWPLLAADLAATGAAAVAGPPLVVAAVTRGARAAPAGALPAARRVGGAAALLLHGPMQEMAQSQTGPRHLVLFSILPGRTPPVRPRLV